MDGDIWLEKYKSLPASKKFIEIFGGAWSIHSENMSLMWLSTDQQTVIDMPEDENEFWSKVLQSVEQRKNLFIK